MDDIESSLAISSASADAKIEFTAHLISPSYMSFISSGSLAGPVEIAPGHSYSFKLRYRIDAAAPFGCFRAFFKITTVLEPGSGLYPNPEDDPSPVDYVVLPSTGTRGRFMAKLRAAVGCRKRLASAEVPNLLNACRDEIAAESARVGALPISVLMVTSMPLYFSAADRTRRNSPLAEVIGEAEDGNAAAILELGFRSDAKSLAVLHRLERPEDPESILSSIKRASVYRCGDILQKSVVRAEKSIPAARQALARRGDKVALGKIVAELKSSSPDAVLYAVAALGYIGEPRYDGGLKALLFQPDFKGDDGNVRVSYPAMRALEQLHPDLARRFDDESDGPDGRLEKWRAWAHAEENAR